MLTVNIIAVGKMKDKWMRDGMSEYSKRLDAFCKLNIIEIPEYRLSDNPSDTEIEKGIEEEAKSIMSKAGKGEIIAMCIEGKTMSSPQLAKEFEKLSQICSTVNVVIGGSYGLSPQIKSKAAIKLSVSPMTFPHQLFRVLIIEQIYRAFAITAGSKYHK